MAVKLTPAQTLAVWQAVRMNTPSDKRFVIGARKPTLDVLVRLGIAVADGGEHYLTAAGERVKRTMTGPTDAPTLDKVAEYVTATNAPKEATHVPTETPATPTCELFAGKEHDDNPPAAVVEVALSWITADGESMRRVKNLCRLCYDDKEKEFIDLARVKEGNTIEVIRRFTGGEDIPRRVGRTTLTVSRRVESSSQEPFSGVSNATHQVTTWLENDAVYALNAKRAARVSTGKLRDYVATLLYGFDATWTTSQRRTQREVSKLFTRGEFDMIEWDAVRDSLLSE